MMKTFLEKVWFPLAVTGAAAAFSFSGSSVEDYRVDFEEPVRLVITEEAPLCDTVIYGHDGYKRGWTEEDFILFSRVEVAADTSDAGFGEEGAEDSLGRQRPAALDTLIAPDSLFLVDTFRFRYYAALKDSLCHVWVRDSLKAAGDTLDWMKLDSLYAADSTLAAKIAFDAWYASLDKKARKKYDFEQMMPIKLARMDSIADRKDSLKVRKDSILDARERILETFVVPDSLMYKRFFTWTHETDFQKMNFRGYADTTYNYHYYSYPFQKEDVDVSWLGVSGSPVQYFDFTKRGAREGVSFYEAQESWSYSPETVPMYNTKTPYTELQYFGTMFTSGELASDNLHLLTSQNISPSLNYTLIYNRFGGGGMLARESTTNKTTVIGLNYIGKRYTAHAGYLYNMVSREENGGLRDNFWIRDTTVDGRDIAVTLNKAQSKIKKNTLFLNQQYRIPFYFLLREIPDPSDTTASTDVTTAFIGHSTEYSTYTRMYTDVISDAAGKEFYDETFYYHPTTSNDSMRVRRFENKVFMRLQPWSDDAIVSKLNVGAGHRSMLYYIPDPTFLRGGSSYLWKSTYLYAGAEGSFKKYISWDATGHWPLMGDESGDFDIKANASLNLYPFRRHRSSPLTIGAHFSTSLKEPEYYQQHMFTNHFRWDNSFSKTSRSEIRGTVDIPQWRLHAAATYTLLANNLYYGTDAIIRQNGTAMSILTGSLSKDFTLGGFLHLDSKALFQLSSNEDVVPLPMVALSSRIYIQMNIQKVLDVQIGGDAHYNTKWYAPAWNPAIGVFHLQNEEKYGGCPYFDVFINAQWKRAAIFARYENVGMGWPMDSADYFSAHHYIKTQRAIKFGMYWPFYTQPQTTGGTMTRGTSSGGASAGPPAGVPSGAGRQRR